jgi:hypothetical protein
MTPGNAHKPELDQLSPAQIRVVCEQLLYTMDADQRGKLMETFPGLYLLIYPGTKDATIQKFAASE